MCKPRSEEAREKVDEIETLVSNVRGKLSPNCGVLPKGVQDVIINAVRGRICSRRHNNDDIIQELNHRGERDIADLVRTALS